ncbi:hypothetical protein ABZT47_38440 [Sphaerisporangium sp. NPDC005289]|uniref:hypothetical protein n=1 Tax=Sphaerisporangium sp. NPDC005289 TaxID=3155247 RepID=UPI0033BF65EC
MHIRRSSRVGAPSASPARACAPASRGVVAELPGGSGEPLVVQLGRLALLATVSALLGLLGQNLSGLGDLLPPVGHHQRHQPAHPATTANAIFSRSNSVAALTCASGRSPCTPNSTSPPTITPASVCPMLAGAREHYRSTPRDLNAEHCGDGACDCHRWANSPDARVRGGAAAFPFYAAWMPAARYQPHYDPQDGHLLGIAVDQTATFRLITPGRPDLLEITRIR